MSNCPACNKPFTIGEPKTTTVTGRTVHAACGDDLLAASAGAVSSPGSPVAGAVSTRGWFRRLKALKHK